MIVAFPGQGSQYVGMGKDFYDNFKCAKEVFEIVDSTLNYKLSNLIFEGPSEKLQLTEYTQPALMTVSLAILKVLQTELEIKIEDLAKYAIGHSVGEYSALCATHALTVADAAYLLQQRGSLMQLASPNKGGMTALLNTSLEQVEKWLEELGEGEIANDNGGGQFIVSGTVKSLERLENLVKSLNKKAIRLAVSGPFHSSYMQSAAQSFAQVINNISIKTPKICIISNVTASPINSPTFIKKLLVEQIYSRVRWRETILFLQSEGYNNYLEIGPGSVLTKMIKNISPHSSTFKLSNMDDLKSILKAWPLKILVE